MIKINRMVEEFKFGQMDRYTKGIGRMGSNMEKVVSSTQMEISKKENGLIIKLMVGENLFMMTAQNTKVNGKTTDNME